MDAAQDAAVPHEDKDHIRRLPAQLLTDLIRRGLLPFCHKRVVGSIAVIPAELPRHLERQLERIIIRAIDKEDPRPVDKVLAIFACGASWARK